MQAKRVAVISAAAAAAGASYADGLLAKMLSVLFTAPAAAAGARVYCHLQPRPDGSFLSAQF